MGYAFGSIDELGEGYGFRKVRAALGVTALGATLIAVAALFIALWAPVVVLAPVAGLLVDRLEARGLLESTLVVWVGEFGRTPRISKLAGRDHWPQCYPAILAGGGVRRGCERPSWHGRTPATARRSMIPCLTRWP